MRTGRSSKRFSKTSWPGRTIPTPSSCTDSTRLSLVQLVDEYTRHVESLRYLEQDLHGVSELIVIASLIVGSSHEKTLGSDHPSPRERQPSVKTVVQPRSNTKILAALSNSGNASSEECDICGESHKNFQCGLLKNLSVSERVEKARSLGLCFNCPRKGHRLCDCPSDRKCMKCRQRHHIQLHDDARVKPDQTDSKKKEVPDKPVPVSTSVNFEAQAGLSSGSASTVTSTCSVQAASTKKNVLLVNVFDRRMNLITKSMADAIAIRILNANVKISGVNNRTTSSLEKTVVKIHSRYSDYQATVECIITPTVTGPIPNTEIDWHIPPGFQLADPEFNCPQDIDMLIGNGLFFKLLKSGEYEEVGNHGPSYSHTVTVEDVYDAVQRFWQIEEVSDQEAKSTEAEECERHFLSTHKRTKEGRFVVQLPLKENANQLSDCRSLALKRFYLLEQRFARDPCLPEQYVDFIREYERLGHCKQIDERKDPPNMLKCYLPHHAVIRPDSSSTKCRVVFDASSKPFRSWVTFNDVLKKKDPATRVTKSIPTVQELRCAMEMIVKVDQRQEFGNEIARVESRKPCRRLGSLSPVLVNGVLRLGGRLELSQLP
ncbi:uncharacterized protein LOC129716973 [Wyeomyia smithii]|uniref:uncharacterized protein LOC129716973 n=1 Tax=Wyeomyia smithii TaxID=174621 RepID=UPI002467EDC1|nr:uncharacterized protein LOC129716973 [Wyeomyia smithii]